MTLAQRRPEAEMLHHSDRGSQYTGAAYRARLARRGSTVSMSRKGAWHPYDNYDNALMESFFGTLKAECVDHHDFQNAAEATTVLFDYLEFSTIGNGSIRRWAFAHRCLSGNRPSPGLSWSPQ